MDQLGTEVPGWTWTPTDRLNKFAATWARTMDAASETSGGLPAGSTNESDGARSSTRYGGAVAHQATLKL